jgi:outer membrane protein OmpA-like peptidoglycan-associated protein
MPRSPRSAARLLAACSLLLLAAPLAGAQQSATTDWPTPPEPSGRYIRLSGTFDKFSEGILANERPGVEIALGTGLHRFLSASLLYAYTATTAKYYQDASTQPGEALGIHRLGVALTPAILPGQSHSLHLVGGAGAIIWNRTGAPGVPASGALTRPFYMGGGEFRTELGDRVAMIAGVRADFTKLYPGEISGGVSGRAGWERALHFTVGLAFHEARVQYAPFTLDRLPKGESPEIVAEEPLVPSYAKVLGHIDGQDANTEPRSSALYTGPQRATVYFDDAATAVPAGDLTKLRKIADLLATTPGTIVVLRGWDVAREADRHESLRVGQQRGDAVREVLLTMAPQVNPQRVSVISMGGDFGTHDTSKARRVELEYLRP